MAKTRKKPVTQNTAETSTQVTSVQHGRKGSTAGGVTEVTTKHKPKTPAVPVASDIDASDNTPSSPHTPAPHTKQGILITLLQSEAGATLEELAEATGWQRHSVHGVMSGVLKKKLGLSIISDKEARGRVYRIADAAHA